MYTKVRTNKKAIISNFAINFPLLPVRFEFHYHRPPPPPLNRFACESFLPLLPPQPSFPFTTSSPPLKIPSPPTIIPFLFGFRYCATTDRLRPASRPHSPHLVENKLKRGEGGGRGLLPFMGHYSIKSISAASLVTFTIYRTVLTKNDSFFKEEVF